MNIRHGVRAKSVSLALAGTLAALSLAGIPGCSTSDAAAPALVSGSPQSLSFPATAVAPGQEDTQCVVMRLDNDAPIRVGSIHNELGDASHHLIVYRVSDTEEKRTPFPCAPFSDTLDPDKGSALMVTQKRDDLLTLPSGVAISLDAHQMVRLEMHFINASPTPKTVTAKTTFTPIRDAEFRDEAGFLFIGSAEISLPPKSDTTLGPKFFEIPADLYGVKFFAMTGHEHHLGTNVQVAQASSASDPGTKIYDVPNWSWSEPKTEVFSAPLQVPNGGGFHFSCSWKNTTDSVVRFGESATDEMCFFWAYYYPNKGARVCFHTTRVGGPTGRDVCCPGDSLCAFAKFKQ
jgi:hypothetical protein